MRNLASDIAAGGNGTYEVCSRLTDYLKQYRYDKRTYIPDGVNVIDYFLYEKKSGYCIHYATALTEMLRCSGIPSRLVEGFCNNYERKDDEGDYNIIGNDSHAWVEAYVRGVGWIRLEPTNGYGVVVKSDDIAEVVDTEEIQESGINIDRNSSADIKNWKITIFAGALILMAISLALICCVRYRQLQKSCDIDVLFDDILRILGKKYAKKEASETVKEYFARLDISDEMTQQLGTLQQCMERLWYGGKDSDNAGYNSVDVDFIKMVRYKLKQGDRKT